MSSRSKIVIVGGVVAVLVGIVIAVVIVTSSFRQPPVATDIRGKWRPDNTSSCGDGTYVVIGEHTITFQMPDQTARQIPFEIAVEAASGHQQLRLYVPGEPKTASLLIQTELRDNALRFVSADWSAAAKDQFGDALASLPAMASPNGLLGVLQKLEPLHWCGQ